MYPVTFIILNNSIRLKIKTKKNKYGWKIVLFLI